MSASKTSFYHGIASLLKEMSKTFTGLSKKTDQNTAKLQKIEEQLEIITKQHVDLVQQIKLISLSSNFCTDKKNSSVNWILGRGKSVTCEAVIHERKLLDIMHVSVDDIINLNTKKNLIGSAISGSIGGFNAHASNIVTAIFAATGQDLGQIITSSLCITTMEKDNNNNLIVSITMPSVEVGMVGGGTTLHDQRSCLDIINKELTVNEFSMLVAGAVMAGELSLLSSLCDNTLMTAHCKLNRGIK